MLFFLKEILVKMTTSETMEFFFLIMLKKLGIKIFVLKKAETSATNFYKSLFVDSNMYSSHP